jgi:hypothetical protein
MAGCDSVDTCLLTGLELRPDTRREHTIPASLGGSITSRRVCCSELNEAASPLEAKLQANYQPLIDALRPLMARSRRMGFSTMRLDDGSSGRIGPDGVLEPSKGFQDLPDGRFVAKNRETAEEIVRKRGIDPCRVEFLPERFGGPVPRGTYEKPAEFLSADIEIAALKAVLLTLDEMLARTGKPQFTRVAALRPVRNYLRDALTGGDRRDHSRFALGYQYDRLEDIRKVIGSLSHARSPFCHTVVATGNIATRTLSAVWIVFDYEPVGFLLCSDWRDYDFTCAVTCSVVAGGPSADVAWADRASALAGYSSMSATYRSDDIHTREDIGWITGEMHFRATSEAQGQAMLLAETTRPAWVLARLAERAKSLPGGEETVSVAEVLRDRLSIIIGRTAAGERPEALSTIEQLFGDLAQVPAKRLAEDEDLAAKVLTLYTGTISELAEQFGLPSATSRRGPVQEGAPPKTVWPEPS